MSGVGVRLRRRWADSPRFNPKLFLSDSANISEASQSLEVENINLDTTKKKRGRKKLLVDPDICQVDPNESREKCDEKEKKNRTKKARVPEEILLKTEDDVGEKENTPEVPKKKRGRKKKYVLAPSESDESVAPPANSPKEKIFEKSKSKRTTRAQKRQKGNVSSSETEDGERTKQLRKKQHIEIGIKKSDDEFRDINETFDFNKDEGSPLIKTINKSNICTGNIDRRSTFDLGIKKLPGKACTLNFEDNSINCSRKSKSFDKPKSIVVRKSSSERKKSSNSLTSDLKLIDKPSVMSSNRKSSSKIVEFTTETKSSSKLEKLSGKPVDLTAIRASIQKSNRKNSQESLKRLGTRKSVRFNVSSISPKVKKSNSFPTVKTPSKVVSPRQPLKREGTFELSPDKSLLRRSLNLNVSGVSNLDTPASKTPKVVDLVTPSVTPNIPRKSYKKTPAKLHSINIINDSNISCLQDTSIPFNDTTFDKSSKLNIDDVSPINKTQNRSCAPIDEKSPASCTSTPFGKSENKLLKKSLSKNDSFKSKCTKMPNFSKIHQRAYEKLENIQELSQRKAERARLLLSGHKPPINMNKSKNSPVNGASKKLFNSSNINKFTPAANRMSSQRKKSTSVEKIKAKAVVAKPAKTAASKVGYTRFGFKLPIEADKNKELKKEQIQAVANKSKPNRSSIEKRRVEIKGVRSNRRFELLMAMRKKKN